ncbi:hypothetical protein SFRURICE_003287 [Spodoptera frugiperda]|nr:hypothetical protein SFRURICE_003287 [Spodoptera frugiperda]
MLISLLCAGVVVALLVLYLRQFYSFHKDGIKYHTPVPLLGNVASVMFRREHYVHNLQNYYNSFPEERFVGRFEFITKLILVRDIELIKKITIKDFEHFTDHRGFDGESFFKRTLFLMRGQEWKDMRSTLSPAFTSSKIRLMVPFMMEVGDQMIHSLNKKLEDSKDDYVDVDFKDLTTRYANDVIASCAYGLKVDSQADPDNQFYNMGKNLFDFKVIRMIMFFVLLNAPKVAKILNWDIVPVSVRKFFTELVLDTMKDRQQRNIVRPDMIHLLMEAKKGKLSHDEKPDDSSTGFATVEESSIGLRKVVNREWTDNDLVSQAFLFFIAGFETVSTAMSFMMYELAVNPDVQDRLVQEIREHDAKNGGKFDFNSIQSMKYLDMVVSEVLRRWPPALVADRECIKDYNMGKPNKNSKEDVIVSINYIRKGTGLMIPILAIHHDPRYFPQPEKFDPERFSVENRHKINMNAYIPFGIGPRNCLGSRFALCEMKVMTYQLLRHMELSPCEKTCIPAKLAVDNLNIRLHGGHWLRIRPRK